MKKIIAMLAFIFFAATVVSPVASYAGDTKTAKSAAHKHECCCNMKDSKKGDCDMKESKKGDCCKMDSKKESSKVKKEDSKKESEKK